MRSLTFWFLGSSILAVWLPAVRLGGRAWPIWPCFYLAALGCALATGVANGRALVAIGLFACLFAGGRSRSAVSRAIAAAGVMLTALALSMHLLPGFSNSRMFSGLHLSPDAVPFTQYLNFDKATAGLFLVAALLSRRRDPPDWRAAAVAAMRATVFTAVPVLACAVAIGFTTFDPRLPAADVWIPFLVVNLLFTCVAEEALFRGWLQGCIAGGVRFPVSGMAVGISALAFGLMHLPGGWKPALLALLAGLGYGLVYRKTRSIEAAIATHFSLNLVHFFGFVYPALAK